MISLKKNKKGELVKATGIRSRASSYYKPNQEETFKISRSKFSDFLKCQRCFYLDRVGGIVSPSTPGWSLNETTDILLKKEFDAHRTEQKPHRTFAEFGLTDVVPFDHPDIDTWRDSLRGGLTYHLPNSNLILHGGVDDIWINQTTQEIILVDYKSQATTHAVIPRLYLSSYTHQDYKVQMDFYAYLLLMMGFSVSSTSYFYVCNADRQAEAFNGTMAFQETLVPYPWQADWIEEKLQNMIGVLNSATLPESNEACENCAYAKQRARLERS